MLSEEEFITTDDVAPPPCPTLLLTTELEASPLMSFPGLVDEESTSCVSSTEVVSALVLPLCRRKRFCEIVMMMKSTCYDAIMKNSCDSRER